LTVCQSQPKVPATSFTLRPASPTALVAQRPARSVMAMRGAAIRRSSSVQVFFEQSLSLHRHLRLCQNSVEATP